MANVSFTHTELKDYVAENFILGETKENGQVVQQKLTKKQSDELIKFINAKAAEEMMAGKDVKLINLGTLKRTERKGRTGRNPITKETMTIPACFACKLDAEKSIKDALKEIPVQ